MYTLLRFQRRYRPVVLARRLANLSEFPLDGVVLELDSRDSTFTRLNYRFPVVPTAVRDPYIRRVTREARRHGCVLLHAHFGWSGPPTLIAARRLGLPLVTTFYGRDLAHKKRRWQWRGAYEELFAEGTLFICEGPAMAEHLVGLGCPRDKIRIVRIGIDLADFPFQLPIRSEPLVVLQAARLVEKKGVDLSIRAFARAREALGPAQLWIVGDGELRSALEALAESLDVADAVRFLGEVSHVEYRAVLRQAHVGIQPSRTASDGDTEGGAPTVLLEMQASGMPVLATRHADIPFVVRAEGCLVTEEDADALADALVRVAHLSDPDWSALSRAGRLAIESEHDASVVAQTVEDLYAEARALVRPSV